MIPARVAGLLLATLLAAGCTAAQGVTLTHGLAGVWKALTMTCNARAVVAPYVAPYLAPGDAGASSGGDTALDAAAP